MNTEIKIDFATWDGTTYVDDTENGRTRYIEFTDGGVTKRAYYKTGIYDTRDGLFHSLIDLYIVDGDNLQFLKEIKKSYSSKNFVDPVTTLTDPDPYEVVDNMSETEVLDETDPDNHISFDPVQYDNEILDENGDRYAPPQYPKTRQLKDGLITGLAFIEAGLSDKLTDLIELQLRESSDVALPE